MQISDQLPTVVLDGYLFPKEGNALFYLKVFIWIFNFAPSILAEGKQANKQTGLFLRLTFLKFQISIVIIFTNFDFLAIMSQPQTST